MKFIKYILVLFCCSVCLVCVSSMVAEKATVKVVDYILVPYVTFVRGMIGGQEQMGNILLGLGLLLVGIFVYCVVLVIVSHLFMAVFKALLSLWRKYHPASPVNETTETERNGQ